MVGEIKVLSFVVEVAALVFPQVVVEVEFVDIAFGSVLFARFLLTGALFLGVVGRVLFFIIIVP